MTKRSLLIGLSIGLAIASATFFNDFIVRQTMLVASYLPIGVFGAVVLLVLAANPLLRLAGRSAPLSRGEIAFATAVALAACGWPGSGFWRYAVTIPSMPAHWVRNAPHWQAADVMSYVPGGSARLAEGHLVDPAALARWLLTADPAASRLRARLDPTVAGRLASLAAAETLPRDQTLALREAVNAALAEATLFDAPPGVHGDPAAVEHWNRSRLAAAVPDAVLPAPPGGHALVTGGRPDPVVIDRLFLGYDTPGWLRADVVPWARWAPTLGVWGGVALSLGFATLCLALIVHPQWSRRELLAYPIPRLVEELAERRDADALPAIAHSRAFWVALLTVLGIHSINGLHAYFEPLPSVPLRLEFGEFRSLFTNARRVALSFGLFQPTLFFSVIGFAFFLPRSVSLSLGLAHPLFVAVGALVVANGFPMEYTKTEPTKTNYLRLGAYLGMALVILYTGRRYYFEVLRGALGGAAGGAPGYAVWAARLLPACVLLAAWLLTTTGMDLTIATLLLTLLFVSWLVITRIVCETGAFFVTIPYVPGVVIQGLLGFEALGPTGLLLLGIANWMLIADPREAVMPYIANALAIAERTGAATPRRTAPWLAVMLAASMVVAGFVTLSLLYQHGVDAMSNDYAARYVPSIPFDAVARAASEASVTGELTAATAADWPARLLAINPVDGAIGWLALGFALLLATAALRIRLPWWPIHPVIWLVWGTYALAHMGFSFLVGCAIKAAVMHVGGVQGYAAVKPAMVGLIAGELLAAVLWMVVGAGYFGVTGTPPAVYSIFPG